METKDLKHRTTVVTGEFEIKISDSRFLSGRVYTLLSVAVLEYPNMKLIDALNWAKGLDKHLCKQESMEDDAKIIGVMHSVEETLKKVNNIV